MSLHRSLLAGCSLAALLIPASTEADFLFWTASNGVYRSNADGTGVTAIVTETPGPTSRGYQGIAVDPGSGFVYWAENTTSQVRRSDFGGGGEVALVDPTLNFGGRGLDIDAVNNRVVWSTANNLQRDDLDPATPFNDPPQGVVNGGTAAAGVALNPSNGQVYWAFDSPFAGFGEIRQAAVLGGPGATVIGNLTGVFDVALDLANGFIYWTEPGADRIARANLDGTGVTTLISGANANQAQGLTLDVANNRLYWVNDNVTNAGSTIFTSSLSGANVQPLLSTGSSINANFIAFAPTPAAVPEPSSALLLAAVGLGAVAARRFRRRGENAAGAV